MVDVLTEETILECADDIVLLNEDVIKSQAVLDSLISLRFVVYLRTLKCCCIVGLHRRRTLLFEGRNWAEEAASHLVVVYQIGTGLDWCLRIRGIHNVSTTLAYRSKSRFSTATEKSVVLYAWLLRADEPRAVFEPLSS